MEQKNKQNSKKAIKYYYMREPLIILISIIGFGINAQAQSIDASTYNRVNDLLKKTQTGNSVSSPKNTVSTSNIGTTIATSVGTAFTSAIVGGIFDWIFNGAERARVERAQQLEWQRYMNAQMAEEQRINKEKFLVESAEIFSSLTGFDDGDTGLTFVMDAELDDGTGIDLYSSPRTFDPLHAPEMISTIERPRYVAVLERENVSFEEKANRLPAAIKNVSFEEAFEQTADAVEITNKIFSFLSELTDNETIRKLSEQGEILGEHVESISQAFKAFKMLKGDVNVAWNYTTSAISNVSLMRYCTTIKNRLDLTKLAAEQYSKSANELFDAILQASKGDFKPIIDFSNKFPHDVQNFSQKGIRYGGL